MKTAQLILDDIIDVVRIGSEQRMSGIRPGFPWQLSFYQSRNADLIPSAKYRQHNWGRAVFIRGKRSSLPHCQSFYIYMLELEVPGLRTIIENLLVDCLFAKQSKEYIYNNWPGLHPRALSQFMDEARAHNLYLKRAFGPDFKVLKQLDLHQLGPRTDYPNEGGIPSDMTPINPIIYSTSTSDFSHGTSTSFTALDIGGRRANRIAATI